MAEYSTMEVDILKDKESKADNPHTSEDTVDKSENTDNEENVLFERISKDMPEKDEILKMSAADTQENSAVADAYRTGAIPKRYREKSPINITKPKKDTEDTKAESAISQSCREELLNQDVPVVGGDLEEKHLTLSEDTTDKRIGPSDPEVQTQQSKTASIPLDSKPTLSLSSTAAIILKALKIETGGFGCAFFFHLTTYIAH